MTPPVDPLDNNIPKIIHHIWLGSALPSKWDAYLSSWRDTHPGWQTRLWTEDTLGPVLDRALFPELISTENKVLQARTNVLRLELMRQFGGVYADVDIMSFRPVEHLLPRDVFVFSDAADNWPNNCYLAAPPDHPFPSWCLRLMHGWWSSWKHRAMTAEAQCDIVGMKGFAHAVRAWAGLRWINSGPVLDDSARQIGTIWEPGFAHLCYRVFQASHPQARPRNESTFQQLVDEARRDKLAYGIHVGAKQW